MLVDYEKLAISTSKYEIIIIHSISSVFKHSMWFVSVSESNLQKSIAMMDRSLKQLEIDIKNSQADKTTPPNDNFTQVMSISFVCRRWQRCWCEMWESHVAQFTWLGWGWGGGVEGGGGVRGELRYIGIRLHWRIHQ